VRPAIASVKPGTRSQPGNVLADTEALNRATTFFAQEAPLARFPYETALV